MDLTFKTKQFITTLYWAPTISPRGWITAWRGRHKDWSSGFVVRLLWLGFLLRWGRRKARTPWRPLTDIEYLIQQANGGDYLTELALAEEPH